MPGAFDDGDAKASSTAVQKRRRQRCRSGGGSAEAAATVMQKCQRQWCTGVDGSNGVYRGSKDEGIKGKSTQFSFHLNLRTESKWEL
ncbi:unnamed protein product [Cuscuta campestris]|uniref:Uncharacterized protein n=1 Tax=Cuscuta campestris TaxID=132261 RepID=A0A484K245_9ASTE|nr:unnamed protein product [Cuscuta campestris]